MSRKIQSLIDKLQTALEESDAQPEQRKPPFLGFTLVLPPDEDNPEDVNCIGENGEPCVMYSVAPSGVRKTND